MIAVEEEVNAAIVDRARTAQTRWGNTSLRDRLAIIRRIRNEIATSADALIEAFPSKLGANRAERLAAELIPLAEACRFLEQEASAVLAVRRRRARRTPFWLRGIALEERPGWFRPPYRACELPAVFARCPGFTSARGGKRCCGKARARGIRSDENIPAINRARRASAGCLVHTR